MRLRTALATLLVVASVAPPGLATADEAERFRLSRDLVAVALDAEVRENMQGQLVDIVTQNLARTIQSHLNRRLLEAEWRNIHKIATRFMGEALPPARMNEVFADVYASLFDEGELRELIRFYGTSAGRKTVHLQGQISQSALQALARVVELSPARATLVSELRREFPSLGPAESP